MLKFRAKIMEYFVNHDITVEIAWSKVLFRKEMKYD